MRGHTWILVAWVAAHLAGCDDAPGAAGKIAPSASAPAPAATAFAVEPFGAAVLTATAAGDGGAAPFKGLVKAVSGGLAVVPHDLELLRGTIELDVSGLTAHGAGDEAVDADAAASWRAALGATSESGRTMRITLRSIESASERDPLDMPPGTRSSLLAATADVELHGVHVEKKVALKATVELAGSALSRVTLTTEAPLRVSLAAHGLKGPGASDELDVTFEVSARPSLAR